jgi:hypothetical protein
MIAIIQKSKTDDRSGIFICMEIDVEVLPRQIHVDVDSYMYTPN